MAMTVDSEETAGCEKSLLGRMLPKEVEVVVHERSQM
jgi:hypothetical protein